MDRPTLPASWRRLGGRSLGFLAVIAVLSACSTSAAPALATPAPAGSAASASSGAAAASGPSTAAATSPTPASAPSAAGPKAKTCRDLLSDSEVRQATGLANAALKSVDATLAIVNETHCRFDAGTTTIDVSVWSGDRLAAFDTLSAAQSNPVTLDIPGVTATFYDLTFMATGLARTADHGVAVGLTPNDTPIPDMKAAATALLRLVLGRI
jgi:hypothetical protein